MKINKARTAYSSVFFLVFALFTLHAGYASGGMKLLEPSGITYDTAIVVREDISVIKQYNAYVSCYNEPLFFTKSGFTVGSIEKTAGDYVRRGDVIISLDTTEIEEAIKEQEEAVEDLAVRFDFDKSMKMLDVEIASLGSDAYKHELLRLEYAQLLETQQMEMNRQLDILRDMREQLLDTAITAPFDGALVQMTDLYPGSRVTAYQPMAYIADENQLFVKYTSGEFYLNNSSSSNIGITGQIMDKIYNLTLIPVPDEEYARTIVSGARPIYSFHIENIDSSIQLGQFVSLKMESSVAKDALTVPVNAVYYGEAQEGIYVYISENNQKILRAVEVGVRNESKVEITSGLVEGDEVFVKQ